MVPLLLAKVGKPPADFPSALLPVYRYLVQWANTFMDSKIVVPLLTLLGAAAGISLLLLYWRKFKDATRV